MGGSRISQARGSSFPNPLSLTRPLPALGVGKGRRWVRPDFLRTFRQAGFCGAASQRGDGAQLGPLSPVNRDHHRGPSHLGHGVGVGVSTEGGGRRDSQSTQAWLRPDAESHED